MTPTEFVLWHRATARSKWQPVACGDSYSASLDQIGTGGRTNGDWLVRQKGDDPNAKPKTAMTI